jgi:type II secretory pathway component PulF
MEASDPGIVADQLDNRGYLTVSIEEEKNPLSFNFSFNFLDRSFSIEDLILFSRQLSTQVNAGIPLIDGLNALSEQAENKRMKEVINIIRSDIESGSSLSDALAVHPKVFSSLYINMIRAGETAGILDEILDRLATLNEYEKDIRARIKAATRYPKIVIIAIVLAFLVLITFVVPRFASMFSKLGAALPLPTRIMIGINDLFHQYWYIGIIIIAVSVFLFHRYINTQDGRLRWDSLKLRVPIFGPLFLKIAISRFTYILGMLIGSGVPIMQTLEITSATIDNSLISQKVKEVMKSVSEGGGLSKSLKETEVFTPITVQMVSVGEQTGRLDEMLVKVGHYYDLETRYTIDKLSSLIEPVLVITIGSMVLFMALAIFLPMWDMASVVFKK